jgi:hypothetical protein
MVGMAEDSPDGEEPSPELVARFESWLRRDEHYTAVQLSIGRFLSEFAAFESLHMTVLLSALSGDVRVIEYLADLIGLGQKLTLLQRLMDEHVIAGEIREEIAAVVKEARKLSDARNVIAHNSAILASTQLTPDADTEYVSGVRLPKGKQPKPQASGARSTPASAEHHLRQSMLVVKDIDACYERAIAMNRRAGIVGVKLRAAIGRDARP